MFLIYHIYLHTGHGVPYPLPQPVWHLKNERWHYYKQSKLLQLSCPESGCPLLCVYWSCGSSVGIVTIIQTGWWRNYGLLPGRGQQFSSGVFTKILGNTKPHVQYGLVALSAGSKQPGCEADHSPQFNTKVKSGWNYIVFPPCAFMVCTWTTSLVSSCILAIHVTTYSLGTERHWQGSNCCVQHYYYWMVPRHAGTLKKLDSVWCY